MLEERLKHEHTNNKIVIVEKRGLRIKLNKKTKASIEAIDGGEGDVREGY